MGDDRHGRHRRADGDRRRRPVDGYRTRDLGRFGRLVDEVLGSLPEPLLTQLDGALVRIEDVPPVDADEVRLALYRPGSRHCSPRRAPAWSGTAETTARGDLLVLYRRPIEARATSRAELVELVREVVVLELADHLGIDDDRLDDLGWL